MRAQPVFPAFCRFVVGALH